MQGQQHLAYRLRSRNYRLRTHKRPKTTQENGFMKPDLNVIDEHRFWDYAFEIYYWEHEIEEGRER